MTIYLVRHGETNWNRQRRVQGRENIHLNASGKRQAELCGRALVPLGIDCILSSPLQRAKKTAELIAAAVHVYPVRLDRRLIERDFGPLSGMTPVERRKMYLSGASIPLESRDNLIDRMLAVLADYSGRTFQNVVMVSHGAAINALLYVRSGGSAGTGKTVLKNGGISRIDCTNGKMQICYCNRSPDEVALPLPVPLAYPAYTY
ncbi:histidine phosphatase family protein [Caproicibacterium lactatifermentans]|jgi:uncharacterized phosphatase|uniref:histidine phosphatase family protein n=1 Tax=Caproicibacterium lactatifermentans TaxID=2666138 RepID=UPI003D911625